MAGEGLPGGPITCPLASLPVRPSVSLALCPLPSPLLPCSLAPSLGFLSQSPLYPWPGLGRLICEMEQNRGTRRRESPPFPSPPRFLLAHSLRLTPPSRPSLLALLSVSTLGARPQTHARGCPLSPPFSLPRFPRLWTLPQSPAHLGGGPALQWGRGRGRKERRAGFLQSSLLSSRLLSASNSHLSPTYLPTCLSVASEAAQTPGSWVRGKGAAGGGSASLGRGGQEARGCFSLLSGRPAPPFSLLTTLLFQGWKGPGMDR